MQVRGDTFEWFLGQKVRGAIDDVSGTVTRTDHVAGTFSVQWCDQTALGDIVYPGDTIMVKKGYPWD